MARQHNWCELELKQGSKGSKASAAPQFRAGEPSTFRRWIPTNTTKTLLRNSQPNASVIRIRATTTDVSQDEIFVMLFCRSVIQVPFMQKARSITTNSWRTARPDGTAHSCAWRMEYGSHMVSHKHRPGGGCGLQPLGHPGQRPGPS